MKKLFYFFLFVICFSSCALLRSSPFEVISWTPGEGYHSNTEDLTVSLTFSLDPDKDSVERRFSLNGGNGKVKGNFLWEGRKVTFVPLTSFEINTDYNLSLSAEAHDTNGLSMDSAFERNFSTRPGVERLFIIKTSPALYEQIDDLRAEARLYFSLPVSLSALYENVSFTPMINGLWRLEDGDKTAIFTPSAIWAKNKRYEIRCSDSLKDINGMNMRNEFKSVFFTGTDKETPVLLSASRITKNGNIIPLERDITGFTGAAEKYCENSGWEKEDKLSLVFSKPVDAVSVKNNLSVEETSSVFMETDNGFNTEFVFYFETAPVYESRFVFKLKSGVKDGAGYESKEEYIYRIFANGEFSKPPRLLGIRMPMSPSDNERLVSFGLDESFLYFPITDEYYPADVSVKTWIELYFDTAEVATINVFSVMELFRIETSNNILTFSPREIKTENFSIKEPKEGWEDYERVEISGYLKNSIWFGIVNFHINSGLKDSLGNVNEKQFKISTIK